MLASVVDAGQHDGTKTSADFLDRARHRAAVELDAIGFELLLLSEEGHAETELLNDDVCEHAGSEQPAANEQGWQRRGKDGEVLARLLDHSCVRGQRLGLFIPDRRLVLGAGEHDADGFRPLVAEFIAQLPADEGAAAFLELSVANLDAALG